jgi:hypothetical protein
MCGVGLRAGHSKSSTELLSFLQPWYAGAGGMQVLSAGVPGIGDGVIDPSGTVQGGFLSPQVQQQLNLQQLVGSSSQSAVAQQQQQLQGLGNVPLSLQQSSISNIFGPTLSQQNQLALGSSSSSAMMQQPMFLDSAAQEAQEAAQQQPAFISQSQPQIVDDGAQQQMVFQGEMPSAQQPGVDVGMPASSTGSSDDGQQALYQTLQLNQPSGPYIKQAALQRLWSRIQQPHVMFSSGAGNVPIIIQEPAGMASLSMPNTVPSFIVQQQPSQPISTSSMPSIIVQQQQPPGMLQYMRASPALSVGVPVEQPAAQIVPSMLQGS